MNTINYLWKICILRKKIIFGSNKRKQYSKVNGIFTNILLNSLELYIEKCVEDVDINYEKFKQELQMLKFYKLTNTQKNYKVSNISLEYTYYIEMWRSLDKKK